MATKKKNMDRAIREAVETGNWMVRIDNDGVSYRGFEWEPVGEWTEAKDWDADPVCGYGLHGVNHLASGYKHNGTHVTFCITRGQQVVVEGDKIKVRYAMRAMVNELPKGLKFKSGLDLRGTQITALPEGLHVGGSLDLRGTQITALPEGLHVGGSLDLSGTQITALPEGLHVGGYLDLRGTQIEGKYEVRGGKVVKKKVSANHAIRR